MHARAHVAHRWRGGTRTRPGWSEAARFTRLYLDNARPPPRSHASAALLPPPQGRKARFVPGWDCHGLPIELKVGGGGGGLAAACG